MKLYKNKNNSFLFLVVGSLLLPLCVNAVQIDPADYERTFNIGFPGYRGSETLTDFPVLIRLSETLNDFKYAKCPDGISLRFADSDGNLIPHEIDTWDSSGTSLVWVKVPSLAKDTVISVYYGWKGAGAPPTVTASDVWSNGYVGVWHMGAATGSYTQEDSTANGLSLTSSEWADDAGVTGRSGVQVGVEGKIGRAVAFDKNGKHYGAFSCTDTGNKLAGFNAFTLEAWTCQDDHEPTAAAADRSIIFRNRAGTDGVNVYRLYEGSGSGKHAFYFKMVDTSDVSWIYAGSSSAPARGEWRYSARCWDGTTGNIRGFEDDVRFANQTSDSYKGTMIAPDPTGTFNVGNTFDSKWGTAAFPGTIDEVRVSNVARSDDWVTASCLNARDADFAVFEMPNDWAKYSHRFGIEFTPSGETGELKNFPVLVKIAEYDEATGTGIRGFSYSDLRKSNGGDLLFADENGNILPREIDTWNPQGESLVWVKIPSLKSGVKITAYYGWQFAPGRNSSDVWDEHYLGVWHMNSAAGSLQQYDSTSNGKTVSCPDSYKTGVLCGVGGKVGSAAQFGLSGDNLGGFAVGDADSHFDGHGAFTMEAWTYKGSTDGVPTDVNAGRIICKMRAFGTWQNCFSLHELKDTGNIQYYLYKEGGATLWPAAQTAPTMGEWHYNACTWDGTAGAYSQILDDSTKSGSSAAGAMLKNDGDFCIGNMSANVNGKQPYRGSIDEVRVSDVARSAGWLKATYDTIENNATFTKYRAARMHNAGLMLIIR